MRSAQALVEAVAAIDPAHSFSLQPRDGVTLCNEAARFMCAVLQVPLVRDIANNQRDWLASSLEWKTVDVETARQRAESGFPTLAVWKNPTGGHGHIAVVVPAPLKDPGGVYVAAAGLRNTNCDTLNSQFGLSIYPEFFTHD